MNFILLEGLIKEIFYLDFIFRNIRILIGMKMINILIEIRISIGEII